MQRMDLGFFFWVFLESEASKPPMSSPAPPKKNPYGNTSCDSPADAWVLINQVTLVSSSSSLCIRVHCILQQLPPPVMIRRIMHRQIHNKYVEDLLLFTAPDNPAARCKVDVRQVQIQVTVKRCWNVLAMRCALRLVWNRVSDVMLFVKVRRVKEAINTTGDTSHPTSSSRLAKLQTVAPAWLVLVDGGSEFETITTLFMLSMCNSHLQFQPAVF